MSASDRIRIEVRQGKKDVCSNDALGAMLDATPALEDGHVKERILTKYSVVQMLDAEVEGLDPLELDALKMDGKIIEREYDGIHSGNMTVALHYCKCKQWRS